MCGRSPAGSEEVFAADHEAPEHVAEDSSLVFRERVYEHSNSDWFSHEAAWFVTVTGAGTSVHPSEHLDFAPVATDEEVAAFHAYISANAGPAD
jgi:hypothetical protein